MPAVPSGCLACLTHVRRADSGVGPVFHVCLDSSQRFSGAADELDEPVRGGGGELFLQAVRPADPDLIDAPRGPESEMRPGVTGGKVAVSAADGSDKALSTADHGDARSDCVASEPRVDGANTEPMPSARRIVAIKTGGAFDVAYQQVDVAVGIDVANRQTTCDLETTAKWCARRTKQLETTFAVIELE